MKRTNRKRQVFGRWISQTLVLGPLAFLMVAGSGCPSLFQSDGQRAAHIHQAVVGRDGALNVSVANTVLNTYTALSLGASKAATVITVDNAAALNKSTFKNTFGKGDLILIIQMAGAAITTNDAASYGAIDTTNGGLGNAGHYEFAGVESVAGNVITLTCGLKNAYTGASGKTQVVRVPQFTTLTVASGASITATPWDRTLGVGGVVAVHAENTLRLDGDINVNGMGFRGGVVAANDTTTANPGLNVVTFRSTDELNGGLKGEGIAGDAAVYGTLNGQYGRGAPANGGGGGDSHNAGGGGGANARHSTGAWTGQGVMSSTVTGAAAWALDPNYADRNSDGGGRGGYSYSATNLDATTAAGAPGQTGWGGDNRRQVGGLGGHPLDNDPTSQLFMGGGGGAGDGNNAVAGPGGNGGGLVFVIAGTVTGTGNIFAKGANGGNTTDSSGGGDAAGGGGGGGAVVVHAASLAGISISADGGVGGSQLGTRDDTEGPGGGGGGGYIAVSGGTVSVSAKGGLGGTTQHPYLSEFPSNGATSGNDGQTNGDATSFLYCAAKSPSEDPDTSIDLAPPDPSGNPRGVFTFSSTEGGVSYQCNLDNAGWKPCDAAYTTAVLPDGHHTIAVFATDLSGNTDKTPATFEWDIIAGELDGGVLNTTIVTSPPKVSANPVGDFTFSSNHPPVTYQCRLDSTNDADWAACNTPFHTAALPDGSHTLEVRATDINGTRDTSPATYTWTIVAGELDGGVLDTTIVKSPPKVSGDPVGTFTFTSNHLPATYQCRLDSSNDADWAACNTPFSTTVLPDGSHTLEVRATDVGGNTDTSPASYTWTIVAGALDGGVLDTIIETHPTNPTGDATGSFTFSSTHGPATYQCKLDKADWAACDATYTTPPLSDGHHTIAVAATDISGIQDTTPAVFGWDVSNGLLDGGVLDAGNANEDANVKFDSAEKDDAPIVKTDVAPQPGLDSALDGQADARAAVDSAGVLDGGVRDAADAASLDGGRDATVLPEPGPDAAVAKEDAAAPFGNKDAAVTIPKPVLLGGGFCTISSSRTSSPAAFALLGLAALALFRRRRSR